MNTTSRRAFLEYSVGFGALAALGRLGAAARGEPDDQFNPPTPKQLRILVLGGTAMLGPAVIDAALARGHTVAMFNRGKTQAERGTVIPESVERLLGDRDPRRGDGLRALEGRTFDAVIDTSGLFPRHVAASAELTLKYGAGQYIFVSSISAYDNHRTPGADESDPTVVPEHPEAEESDPGFVYTGELKRPCEQAAQRIFGERATIVRSAYLVGPGDATGRFAYWPIRVSEATGDRTEMLVPGSPTMPVQVVDVRDLGNWLVKVTETKTTGVFNACGPKTPLTFGQILSACEAATGRSPKYTWVSWEFISKQRLNVPIVLPPEGDFAGFHQRSSAKAIAAGLTFRPIRETIDGILEWWGRQPEDRRAKLRGGMTMERESEAMRAWTR